MSALVVDGGTGLPWRTRGARPGAPVLGPAMLVEIAEERRVPVPRCNNEGQVVHRGARTRVGRFRSAPGEENFRFSGVPGEHIVVFQRGAVRLRRLGGAPYFADSVVVHFLDPDQIYFRDGVPGENDWCTWIGVDASLVARLQGDPATARGALRWRFRIAPVSALSYLLCCELAAAIQEGGCPDALLRRATHLLLRLAIDEAGRFEAIRGDTLVERSHLGERARELLFVESASRRTLAELATELGCSPSHLGRLLRRHLGMSPHRYRLQIRLRRALVALIEGERDLADLALRCGFASHSHFTTAFGRSFGVTPSVFQRRAAGERLRDLVGRIERGLHQE